MREVRELPTTSVAEFRSAAWSVFNHHLPISVALGVYLTWCALGFTGGLLRDR